MSNENSKKNIQKFTRILSESSQKFLTKFFDDSRDEQKKAAELQKQLNLAVAQKSFVVIQLKSKQQNAAPETVSGRVMANNKIDSKTIVIKTQKEQQLKMIAKDQIRKISILHLPTSTSTEKSGS